ncbi:hypothetical protein NHX12_006932 [Muraenolepis orangiensis]|uniref:Uncharacterized protein n=1 Tax=Muraenolepis orangiensis TaxID=630683 RepID=A0A9Q0DRB7_9TELE|nr:hypothetical protein NHX12_006932 [Muraenolepis orangiensis]
MQSVQTEKEQAEGWVGPVYSLLWVESDFPGTQQAQTGEESLSLDTPNSPQTAALPSPDHSQHTRTRHTVSARYLLRRGYSSNHLYVVEICHRLLFSGKGNT